jgi:hypothetical protein
MASTTFIPGVTKVLSSWLNDVNTIVYSHVVNPELFPWFCKFDNLTDDGPALAAMFAAITVGTYIKLPAGVARSSIKHTLPVISGFKIEGAGRQVTQILYTGASTTGDIFTVGDGVTSLSNVSLTNFNVDSNTTMTSGVGIHIKKVTSGGNNYDNLSLGKSNTTKKLWDGIKFTNTNVASYIGFEINCQREGLVVVGDVALDSGSDLIVDKGTIIGGTVGIHQGGGFGGLYVGDVLCYGQTDTSYLQDNTLVARANRETILSDRFVVDAGNANCIRVNETVGTNSILHIGAFVTGAGFFAASPGDGIYIQSMPIGRVSITSSQIKGNKRHGIRVEDSTCFVSISPTTFITDNLGWGIFATIPINLEFNGARYLFNTAGDIHPNVRDWISYTPILGSSGGPVPTGTITMKYRKQASTRNFTIDALVSNNNGGTGALIVFLPFNVREATAFSVVERATSGQSMQAFITAGSSAITILTGANAYPAVNGSRFTISGTCEV